MELDKPKYINAVESLVGGEVGGYSEGPISKIRLFDEQTPPTEEAIQKKLVELLVKYDAQAYSRKREAEYPSLQECVHAILDDTLDALQAKRAEIKTKYPKGG